MIDSSNRKSDRSGRVLMHERKGKIAEWKDGKVYVRHVDKIFLKVACS